MPPAAVRALCLTAVLTAAALLRLAGLHWGLPDATHPGYSYHPDETALLLWAEGLSHGHIIPRQFIFGGTLYSSVLNGCIWLAERLDGTLDGINLLADAILAGRALAVASSLLTVWLVYRIGQRLFSAGAGLIGATALALAPAHAFLSGTARPDALATLAATSFLYLAVPALQGPTRGDLRTFLITGALLGATLALRFPIAAFAVAPVAAYVLRTMAGGGFAPATLVRLLAACGAVAVGAYALTSPHTLLYPEVVLQGLRTTWTYESSVFVDAVGRGPQIYQYGWTTLLEALGAPLYALAVLGVGLAFRRRTPADVLVLATALPYFVLMILASWVVVRYTLPLLPLLALLIGAGAQQLLAATRLRGGVAAVLVAACAWTLVHDAAFTRLLRGPDVRDVAAAWIGQALPADVPVVTAQQYDGDVYFLPPLPEARTLAFVVSGGVDARALLEDPRAQHLVVHENVYGSLDRLRDTHPSAPARALLAVLESGRYELLREFKQPVAIAGLDFSHRFESLDFRVLNPGIRIYRRRDATAPLNP